MCSGVYSFWRCWCWNSICFKSAEIQGGGLNAQQLNQSSTVLFNFKKENSLSLTYHHRESQSCASWLLPYVCPICDPSLMRTRQRSSNESELRQHSGLRSQALYILLDRWGSSWANRTAVPCSFNENSKRKVYFQQQR